MAARCSSCRALLNPRANRCAVCDAPVTTAGRTPIIQVSHGALAALPADELVLAAELGKALAPSIHLRKRIGRGGMGIVFLARDESLKRDVAIKVLTPDLAGDPTTRTRFIREAEAAAAVSHPNIVNIYHVGLLPQTEIPYFVMQYIEGPSMSEAAGRMLPEARVRRVIGEVASGLAAAHRRGVVHRDIKPGNIVIDGETGRALLLDFGISAAAAVHPTRRSDRLTSEGSFVGTPAYMSPESAAGEEAIDKSDVYSLGVVAYELLTGKPPFPGSGLRVMAAHVNDELPDLHQSRADLSPEIVELVERSLAKNPADRPTAQAIVDHLLPGSRQGLEWPPPGLAPLRRASAQFRFGLASLVVTIAAFLFAISARPDRPDTQSIGARATAAFESGRHLVASRADFGLADNSVADNVIETEAVWAASAYATFALLLLATCFVAVQTMPTLRAVRMARRSGYPWSTIADVMSDMRRDGGDLMTGLSVYAFCTERERSRLLRMRRFRLAGIYAAAMLAVVSLVAWVSGWFASETASDLSRGSMVPVWLIVVPGSVLVACGALAASEAVIRRRRAQADEEWQSAHLVNKELVSSWVISAGRKFSGSTGLSRVPIEIAIGVFLVGVVAAALIIANAGMRASIRAASDRSVALAWAAAVSDSVYASGWRTRDAILTKAAGSLSVSSPALDQSSQAQLLATFVPPAVGTRHLIPRQPEDSQLYVGDSKFRPAFDVAEALGRLQTRPGDVAPIGRDEEQLPAGALGVWRAAAHAELLPYFWPFRASGELEPLAVSQTALQTLAVGNLRDGIVALSKGDYAMAEFRARENLAVARQLVRAGTSDFTAIGPITSDAALVLAQIGRAKKDTGLIAEAGAVRSIANYNRPLNGSVMALFADPGYLPITRLIGDTLIEPATRIRLAQMTAVGFCENPREVLFGVSQGRLLLLRRAAESLGDLPGATNLVAPWEAWLAETVGSGVVRPTPPVVFQVGGAEPSKPVAYATKVFRLKGLRSRLTYCSLG